MERVSLQSCEQLLMTIGTSVMLSQWFDHTTCYDQRLAVASGLLYSICRPLYAAGYIRHPLLRLPGLLAGNFWTTCAYALYCTLRTTGVEDSQLLLHSLYVLCPVCTFLGVGAALAATPKPAAKKK